MRHLKHQFCSLYNFSLLFKITNCIAILKTPPLTMFNNLLAEYDLFVPDRLSYHPHLAVGYKELSSLECPDLLGEQEEEGVSHHLFLQFLLLAEALD